MGYPHKSHEKETVVLSEYFGDPEARSYDGWVKRGGYKALKAALDMSPAEVVEVVKASGLRGRGGAGFQSAPAARLSGALPAVNVRGAMTTRPIQPATTDPPSDTQTFCSEILVGVSRTFAVSIPELPPERQEYCFHQDRYQSGYPALSGRPGRARRSPPMHRQGQETELRISVLKPGIE